MKQLPLLLGLVALGACAGDPGPVAMDYELPADQVMIGVTHTPTTEGIRSAIGQFDTVYVFEDSSRLHLKGVNLELFDATGVKTATLTSQSGELDTDTQAMIARGTVRLVTVGDPRIIETEELHYDPSTRRVWSDVRTKQTYRGEVLVVDGFNSDDQFKKVEFRGPQGRLPNVRVRF
jgi:LPS export ABC transporter protein LptC